MTKSTAFVVLSVVALFAQSFKPVETVQSPIVAQVAGNSFVLNAEGTYAAQLTGGKTAILSFTGNDLKAKDGYAQEQKMRLEYKINEVGDILVKGISYELDGKKFISIPDATSMNVTKYEWSSDKKSFVISAAFDCKAQSEGPFQSNNDAIAIKGTLENVKVNVAYNDVAAINE